MERDFFESFSINNQRRPHVFMFYELVTQLLIFFIFVLTYMLLLYFILIPESPICGIVKAVSTSLFICVMILFKRKYIFGLCLTLVLDFSSTFLKQ